MTSAVRNAGRLCLLIGALHAGGCFYSTPGQKLGPIPAPPAPAVKPAIEYTVGDFSFTLEGGKMVTSNFAGRLLLEGILDAWKEKGYIGEAQYVETGAFTGSSTYQLTLSGSQYGESSIVMQILSGLTLFVVPHSVIQHYDVTFTLVDPGTGQRSDATVQESNEVYSQLFLVFALPWANRGNEATYAAMGDHLYAQLDKQGAFQSSPAAATAP